MIYGFSNFGYEGNLVAVETKLRNGTGTDILGIADSSVAELRTRVKSAIQNSGYEYPDKKVLITLSPADLKKDGIEFDLPIALSILCNASEKILVMGGLLLDGTVMSVKGTFSACQIAIKNGIKYAILPEGSPVPEGIKVLFVKKLNDALTALKHNFYKDFKVEKSDFSSKIEFQDDDDITSLDNINNDYSNNLKFAMAVAVAGKHNLFVSGCVGNGKTGLLQNLPQILPKLSFNETQSVTRIYSLAGLVKPNQNYLKRRPFRIPYQTATIKGICGGGQNCRPGEISLAHNGVLFLDEATEFRTSVLQMLKVPITNRSITLSRAGRSTIYPADFQLVMASQPCPCGNYGSKDKICLCSAKSIEQYWRKLSNPLLDRMEIRFDCNSDDFLTTETMTVAKMRELIINAWTMQMKRGEFNGRIKYASSVGFILTDEMTNWFDSKGDLKIVQDCISQDYRLDSHRMAHQVLTLARTLADMRSSEKISHSDVELALKLRADTFLDKLN